MRPLHRISWFIGDKNDLPEDCLEFEPGTVGGVELVDIKEFDYFEFYFGKEDGQREWALQPEHLPTAGSLFVFQRKESSIPRLFTTSLSNFKPLCEALGIQGSSSSHAGVRIQR